MLRFVQLILQRRNVTDLGIRRASPARVSPGSAVGSTAGRGRSPVRTTRATAQSAASKKSPTRLQNGTPAGTTRSTRADSKSPTSARTEDGTRGRNPVRTSVDTRRPGEYSGEGLFTRNEFQLVSDIRPIIV